MAFARRAWDSVAAGRSPTSRPWRAPPQLELLGRPAPRKLFLPTRAQKLLPCFLAPSPAKEAGSAFELAWWLRPAAGSFGDALVGTVWGGLEQGIFSFSHWAGGEDLETVVIVFVVVLLGRDG